MKRITAFLFAGALLFFTACGASLRVQLLPSGEQHIVCEGDVGRALYNAIQDAYEGMNPGAGAAADFVIFDEASIREALSARGFTNISATAFDATHFSLSADGALSDFVSATDSSLEFRLEPEAIRRAADALPEDTRYFLDLLMAPVLTGEEMGGTDYVDTVAAVYGASLADELERAAVTLTLASPGGDEAAYSIPLVELLTLSDAKTYTLSY